jgi:hypothetical protein
VYWVLRQKASHEMVQRLDSNDYAKDQTLTVKVPFTLPYQTDQEAFERLDGEFERDGMVYKLVEHKLERDTLYIVYIKDHQETSIYNSLVNFVQANTDNPISKKALKLIENFAKDYLFTTNSLHTATAGWSRETSEYAIVAFDVILTDSPVFSPPPEFLS